MKSTYIYKERCYQFIPAFLTLTLIFISIVKGHGVGGHPIKELSTDHSKLLAEQSKFSTKSNNLRSLTNTTTKSTPVVKKWLGICVRFSDHVDRKVHLTSTIDKHFNSMKPGELGSIYQWSVKRYFKEMSYGKLTINTPVVPYWIDLLQTQAYYAGGESGLKGGAPRLISDALSILDKDPNFRFADYDQDGDKKIDGLVVIHSGNPAEAGGIDAYGNNLANRMYSHMSSTRWIGTEKIASHLYMMVAAHGGSIGNGLHPIGIWCHEAGHMLGLPDLYGAINGVGIGRHALMSSGGADDGSPNRHLPGGLFSWSKLQLGWVTPRVISEPGTYTIKALGKYPEVIKIETGYRPGEYLLISNRFAIGADASVPAQGLAIYRVNENKKRFYLKVEDAGWPGQNGWPENGVHFPISLLQADGAYELEKGIPGGESNDYFSANGVNKLGVGSTGVFPNTDSYATGLVETGNEIYDISAIGETMTFKFRKKSKTSYESWAASKGLGGPEKDDDKDGMSNFLEYVQGEKEAQLIRKDGVLIYSHLKRYNDPNLVYSIETTADLKGTWTSTSMTMHSINRLADGLDEMNYVVSPNQAKHFIRLKVTR